MEVLLAAPGPENLVALAQAHNELDRRAFGLPAASAWLSGVLLLDVSANHHDDGAAGAVLPDRSPHLARLPWLLLGKV